MALIACILNSYDDNPQTASVPITAEMATALQNKDLKKLRKLIECVFSGIPYTSHKKRNRLSRPFFLTFSLPGLYIKVESATNDGRIAAVSLFSFELKLDNAPITLEQIKAKEYLKSISGINGISTL